MTATFPPGFLWGTATSAHQTEGGNVNSDWWAFEHDGFALVREPSGDAADSYHRWPEDMDLVVEAGFTDYRFSVEWARIEPAPGEISTLQLDHYRRMVDGALARGLRPLVTLHHFTSPRWFEEAGGWRARDAIDRFSTYVDAVGTVIAEGVERVCTINEPNMVALLPVLRATNPRSLGPGLPEPDATAAVTLVAAHHAARAVLRERCPGVQVGWSVACFNFTAEPDATQARDAHAWPRQTRFVEAARDDDWIGVQAYTRNRLQRSGEVVVPVPVPDGVERTLTGWEYYPAAVGDAVREVAAVVPGVPIIVTENGIATRHDARRIAYTRDALDSLAAAVHDGVDVRGYFHWSLLDNYEWGSYTPTFGLVAVDRQTFVRTPKPSLAWLGALRPRAAEVSLTDIS